VESQSHLIQNILKQTSNIILLKLITTIVLLYFIYIIFYLICTWHVRNMFSIYSISIGVFEKKQVVEYVHKKGLVEALYQTLPILALRQPHYHRINSMMENM